MIIQTSAKAPSTSGLVRVVSNDLTTRLYLEISLVLRRPLQGQKPSLEMEMQASAFMPN